MTSHYILLDLCNKQIVNNRNTHNIKTDITNNIFAMLLQCVNELYNFLMFTTNSSGS